MMGKKAVSKTMPMRVLEEKNIPYTLCQQAHKQFTAEGVAGDLGVPVAQVVKAMLLQLSGDSGYVLAVVPGDRRLSLKKTGQALGDKHIQLASQKDVERITGFTVGAVSVLGLRRQNIPCLVDEHIVTLDQVLISSGRPDMGLCLKPGDMILAAVGKLGDFCEDE
jgi:Cys-tRNA(Pro)/Cys-tRNA(Cys) deacylase